MEMEVQRSCCPICLEEFDNSSVETEKLDNRCGHAVHRHCFLKALRAGNYTCSICREPFGDIKDNLSQPNLKRYVKMLQQNFSFAIVRQRMEADQISPTTIDSFFTGGSSLVAQDSTEACMHSKKTSFDISTYARMLKVGMAEGAVRQRMEVANISSDDIDAFFCEMIDQSLK